MQFSVNRDTLLQPLQAVQGVVERRQTTPILANVLLICRDDSLSVSATDMELQLVATTALEGRAAGFHDGARPQAHRHLPLTPIGFRSFSLTPWTEGQGSAALRSQPIRAEHVAGGRLSNVRDCRRRKQACRLAQGELEAG